MAGKFDPGYFYKNPLKLIPAILAATVAFFVSGPGGAMAAFVVVAGIEFVNGTFLKPSMPESNFTRESPTYGFTQWRNRVKGDATLPVAYTGEKHKIAPIYVQSYTTPQGEQDDDFSKVLKARGQGLSGLLAICEGPIVSIEDIRLNDEPVFEKVEGRAVATGNGSKKVFRFSARRGVLKTLKVYVAGESKGWNLTPRTWTFDARTTGGATYHASLPVTDALADERDLEVTVNGSPIDLDDINSPRPHIWAASENELRVTMQTYYADAPRIAITYYVRTMDGLTVRHDRSANEFVLEFATAPASGAAITVDFSKKMFSGLEVNWRNGADHQLHMPAFESIRNTYARGIEVTSSEQTFDTENEVDNVILSYASGPGGFTAYDDEGNRDPVEARFRLEVKRQTSATGNIFNTWQAIRDPAGKKGTKGADEFSVRGDSISQLFWAFSIRGLLDKHLAANKNNATAQKMRRDFVRAKYSIRVKRTNPVKSDTNGLFADELYLSTYEEIIDEWLSYPGVAMLSFHAAASEKLQGSAPNVTCVVKGVRSVESYDGEAWTQDEDAQGNRVWAAIDLLTNKRYGSGDFYTKATSFDLTSALAAATWLDEQVTLEGGGTERRSRLDIVLDVKKSPLQWATDILRPGRVIPVLQGNRWRFVIDDAVDLDAVPTIWEDGTSCRIAKDALRVGHDSAAVVPNELHAGFLDESEDWEPREAWVAPRGPAEDRHVQSIELFGTTRRSEAVRTTNALHTQVTSGALSLEMTVAPEAVAWEAGDVVRVRSTRLGLDEYIRIARVEFGTSEYFVRVQGVPYVPAVYGQQDARQVVPQPATVHGAPTAVVVVPAPATWAGGESTGRLAARRSRIMPVAVRRVA